MPATAGSLFNIQQNRIEEVLNRNIEFILPGLDEVWDGTISTSMGVGPSDAIGRDMKIIRLFMGGMTGVLEQAKPRGDFPLYGDLTSDVSSTEPFGKHLFTYNQTQTFPDALESANLKPYRLGIGMRAMVTNLPMTLGESTAEAQDAFIGQILAPKLTGFARQISHTMCNYFYLSQNKHYQLATVGSIAGVAAAPVNGAYYFTFKPTNEASDRFFRGQRIDWYDSLGVDRKNDTAASAASPQTPATRIKLFVDYVDELTNTVRVVTNVDPDGTWAGDGGADPANGDIIVYANSRDNAATPNFTGIAGINSWCKTGGESDTNLLGAEKDTANALDVMQFPEHKSMSYDFAGAPLTEHLFRQILRRFHAAKRKYGQMVDTTIASEGVYLAYLGTKMTGTTQFWDRSSGPVPHLNSEGFQSNNNFGGFTFAMDGRTYRGMTSTYVDDGVMYIIKTGGQNWKKYVPRETPGTTAMERNEVPFFPFRFVASALTGLSTNRLPIYDTDASGRTLVTELSQMPGWMRMQLVPDQFSMIRLTSLATDKVYSDQSAVGFV